MTAGVVTPVGGRANRARKPMRSGGVTGRYTKATANGIGIIVLVAMLFPIYWAVATSFKRGIDMTKVTPEWFPDSGHAAALPRRVAQALLSVEPAQQRDHRQPHGCHRDGCRVLRSSGRRAHEFPRPASLYRADHSRSDDPQTALIIPLFVMLSKLHLQNQLIGVTFTYLAFILPFCIWTLRGFVANIPKDLEDAAMIDGCSRIGAFMRVTFPLIAPGLVATSIFAFIQAWNEFTFAYVIIQDNKKETATVWLASFITQEQIDWGGLMAGATMLSIPIVILFLLVQRHVATGLTAGAVKG